jgi:hypothetical protein
VPVEISDLSGKVFLIDQLVGKGNARMTSTIRVNVRLTLLR